MMLRPAYTVILLIAALFAAVFKAGFTPVGFENALIDSRATPIYALMSDESRLHLDLQVWARWKNNPWAEDVAQITRDVRQFDVELERNFQDWKQSGDDLWVEEMVERQRALRDRVRAGRREMRAAGE